MERLKQHRNAALVVTTLTLLLGVSQSFLVPIARAQTDPVWSQRAVSGPPERWAHRMVYDEARQECVLFGGLVAGGPYDGETWGWDACSWTLLANDGPSPRHTHGMAYDRQNGMTVLFGGFGVGRMKGDTWVWDGAAWTMCSQTGPTARNHLAMVYDDGRQRIVLFGGYVDGGPLKDDTWAWDGNTCTWTELPRNGEIPSPRYQHAMAYDSVRGEMVLFGGWTGGAVSGETFLFDGTAWRRGPSEGPPARCQHTMSYDADRQVTVLFGGNTSNDHSGPYFGDTWEWDGTLWTQRSVAGPSPRLIQAMAYDSDRRINVLFGGWDGNRNGETWEHHGVPQSIAPGVVAGELDLALYNGNPGVVYTRSDPNRAIYYAEISSGCWRRTELITGRRAREPTIAFNTNGEPHVVYSRGGTYGDLEGWHASRVGGVWGEVQFQGNYATQFAFSNIGPDNFRVAYNSGSHDGGPAYYRDWTNGQWGSRQGPFSPSISDPTAHGMTVAPDGRIGLVLRDLTPGIPRLRYFEDTGLGFSQSQSGTVVNSLVEIGGLVYDSTGRAYTTYRIGSQVYLAWHDPGTPLDDWVRAAPSPGASARPQIAMYDDMPFITYGVEESGGSHRLIVASYDGGQWRFWLPTTDRAVISNQKMPIAIDDLGVAHIAYLADVGANGGEPRYVTVDVLTSEFVPGDVNCDGRFNGADIDPFFLALGDPGAYATRHPAWCRVLADMNADGIVNCGDIDPFFQCLGGGNCP